MSESSKKHPDEQQLVDFGHGKLAPDQTSEIVEHLDHCVQCNDTLLNLADDTFTGLVRSLPEPDDVLPVELPDGNSSANSEHEDAGRSETENELTSKAEASDEPGHAATMLVQSGQPIESSELPDELRDHPRYRIVDRIGSGGMGDVYRAEHRLMNRSVALKLINSQLVKHPQAVERFRREVQAAAQLTHPNIVTAFDAEQAGDVHFLAMEFVEGTDLATVVQHRGALPVSEACDCIRQAAEGLQHAHEKGMVHRDIKPHNLMLSPDGQVRILDFGLAGFATESAIIESDSTDGTERDTTPLHLTTFGSVMGTPDYIAPEQARDAHSADIRADIYSLGCTLYCLLSGKPPHETDSVVEKLKAHAEREPRPIESVQIDVPPELAEVVRRMMAKDPADRFQTPAEVADALAPFVDQHRTDGGGLGVPARETGHAAPQNPLPITFALCFTATISTLAFVLAGTLFKASGWGSVIPSWSFSWLHYGGLISIPVGIAALFYADRSERKNSYASAVTAGLLNLLPLNPFVVVLLPLTIWTLHRLRNPLARTMYETCPTVDREEDKRRWSLVVSTVACLLIAMCVGTLFVVQLGRTTLKFEIDDPTLAVRFKGESISIDNDGNTIDIKPGQQQELVVEQNGVEVETDTLVLRKGDKVVLRVSVVEGKVMVDAGGARVRRQPPSDTTPSTESDQQLIQGKWRRVGLTDDGEPQSMDGRTERFMTFTGDQFTGPQRKQPKPGKFSVDATTSPKQIDLHFRSGPNSYIRIQGIYRLEGDRLTIFQATDWTASRRPTSFEPKPGDKRSLLVFERVRVSDLELLQGAWTATALEFGGQKAPKSAFDGKRMMFAGDWVSRFGKVNQIRKFHLDPTTNPKQIDIGASVEGQFSKAIYELNGDTFRLCLPQTTKHPRPKDFDTAGTRHVCVTLQRAELNEYDKLQGTWKAVALEARGQDAPEPAWKDRYMVIRGEQMTRVGRLGAVEAFLDEYDFRVDPTASPKTLDISKTDDGKFEEFSQSIYELNGDTLRVCFADDSKLPRPSSFDTAGTGYFCMTMKRTESRSNDSDSDKPAKPPVPKTSWIPEYGKGPIQPGVNLVNDPSLEDTAVGERFPKTWGNGNLIPTDAWDFEVVEGGRTGKRSWRIEGDGSAATVPTNRPPVDRAYRYAARAWVKVEAGMARLGLLYFDKNFRYIDGRSSSTTTVSRGWHQLTMIDDFANHPDAAYVSLAFVMVGPGKAVFDDVELIPFAADNLPENFEAEYASPKHDPALFDRWVGRWKSTAELKGPDGHQETQTGSADVRTILDDRVLSWHWTSDSGDSEYLSLLAFDENIGAYRDWGFDLQGAVYERVGTWKSEPGTLTLHMQPTSSGNTGTTTDRFIGNDQIDSLLVDRNSEGQIISEIRTTWTRTAASVDEDITTASGPAAEPQELEVLQKLAGQWTIDSTSKPSVWTPDGSKETLTERSEWVVGGKLLLFRTWNDQQELRSVALMNWDPIDKSYHYRHFAADVVGGQWRITWDKSSKGFHWNATDMPAGWIGTGFNRWIDDDMFDNQALIKDEQGRVLMDSHQKRTRVK